MSKKDIRLLNGIVNANQRILDEYTFDIIDKIHLGINVQLMVGDMVNILTYDCLERKFETVCNEKIVQYSLYEIELSSHLGLINFVKVQSRFKEIQLHTN
jgi:hypothetical protein